MKLRIAYLRFVLPLALAVSGHSELDAQTSFPYRPVAVDGLTPVPGGGGLFGLVGNGAINNSGNVVFSSSFGSGGSQFGVFSDMGSGLAVVARSDGTPLPGTGGSITALGGSGIALNQSSVFAFYAAYGSGSNAGTGVFSNLTGSFADIALTNPATSIPGVSATFSNFQGGDVSVGGNSIAFAGQDSAGQIGAYRFANGQLSKLLRSSDPVPGESPRVFYGVGGRVSTNQQDSSTYLGLSYIPGTPPTDPLAHIFTSTGTQRTELIRTGTSAPGTSIALTSLSVTPKIDQSGNVTFFGRYGTSTPLVGLFSQYEGNLIDIARPDGPIAPGTNGHFSFLDLNSYPRVSVNNGRILFYASTSDANSGLWLFDHGSLTKLVLASDHASDSGLAIGTLQQFQINSRGDVAFTSLAVNGRPCLFFYDASTSAIRTLVTSNQSWDLDGVPGGATRTVQDAQLAVGAPSSGADGFPSAFNDNDQILVWMDFTNLTSGLYVISVPEPNTIALTMTGVTAIALGYYFWRKRRNSLERQYELFN